MRKSVVFTIDVEPDLYGSSYKGITEGLKKFEILCDRFSIKPILFVTTNCIVRYPSIFKRWHNKGWEISLHGLTHKRFDEMTLSEKKHEISESIRLFKKHIGAAPNGFRAPQHSIDDETLDLLEKYEIHYDSSMTPFNLFDRIYARRNRKII
jgi:peptidoglycan/xylan/chitin deacetylase (PgdA/CDA1 family)